LILDCAHNGHHGTPKNDDASEEVSWRVTLEYNVRERLGTGIGNEKDSQGIVVIAAMHMKGCLQVGLLGRIGDFRIANVGTIQERQEIQERKPRNQPEIDLPKEGFVLSDVSIGLS
jgi:hypothetical protein